MNPGLRFVLACSGISLVVTYFWWVKVRVWMFRQDLFRIRDELWDSMVSEGMADDPDYRSFREAINAVIRLAPVLSIVTVLGVVLERDEFRVAIPDHPRLAPLVKARNMVFYRVTRYLLLETLSGLSILALLVAFGLGRSFFRAISRRVEWLIDTHEFQGLDRRLAVTAEGQLLEV